MAKLCPIMCPITQTLHFKVLTSCSYCCSCSCMVTRSQNIIRSYLLSISDIGEVRCLILKDNTQPSPSVMTPLYLLPHHQTTEQSVRIRNSNFALQPWLCKMTIKVVFGQTYQINLLFFFTETLHKYYGCK